MLGIETGGIVTIITAVISLVGGFITALVTIRKSDVDAAKVGIEALIATIDSLSDENAKHRDDRADSHDRADNMHDRMDGISQRMDAAFKVISHMQSSIDRLQQGNNHLVSLLTDSETKQKD